MAKQLLIDAVPFRFSLTEDSASGKLVARGPFGYADKPTENRRVYPRHIMERELRRLENVIGARKVFGECDHPADGKTKLSRASHLITGLELDVDGTVAGVAEVMNTQAGQNIRAIYEAGGQIGVSSRGYGSVTRNEDGYDVVQEDFQLDTYDFVADPAQRDAYPDMTTEAKAKPAAPAITEGGACSATDEDAVDQEQTMKNDLAKTEAAPPALPVEGQGSEGAAPETDADGGGLTAAGDTPSTSNEAEKPRTTEEKYVPGVITKADGSCKPNPNAEAVEAPAAAAAVTNPEDETDGATVEARVAEAIETVRAQVFAEAKAAAMAEARAVAQAEAAEHVRAAIAESAKALDAVTEERDQLARAVKDLGFNLLARDALAAHPQAKKVVEGLGDLTRFTDSKALGEALSPHVSEAKRLTESASAKTATKAQRLVEDNRALSERLQKASDANKTLTRERDVAAAKAHAALVECYMERSISGMPQAIAIRGEFKKLETKNKDTVDRLVEGWKRRSTEGRSTGDFARMRRGMTPPRRPTTVVEDSLRASLPASGGEKIMIVEGFEQSVQEVERLSGELRG